MTKQQMAELLLTFIVRAAIHELAEENDHLELHGLLENWPAGQSWTDLGSTSKHTFIRRAFEHAGVDHDLYSELVGDPEVDLDEIWIKLIHTPEVKHD